MKEFLTVIKLLAFKEKRSLMVALFGLVDEDPQATKTDLKFTFRHPKVEFIEE